MDAISQARHPQGGSFYDRAVAYAERYPNCSVFDLERALFLRFGPAQKLHKRLIADGIIDDPGTIPAQAKAHRRSRANGADLRKKRGTK